MRTSLADATALSLALVSLAFVSTVASYPVSSEHATDSALLTVIRRHPARYNHGHQSPISLSEARYDCHSSAVKENWTGLKRYAHVYFRSYTEAFREYVPPPARADELAQFHGLAPGAVAEAPMQQTSHTTDPHKSCIGAVIAGVLGLLALSLIVSGVAAAIGQARRRDDEAGFKHRYQSNDIKSLTLRYHDDKSTETSPKTSIEKATLPLYSDADS